MSQFEEDADLDLATLAIHGDDYLALSTDVSSPIHVSTTFRYPSDPSRLKNVHERTGFEGRDTPIYSRISQPVGSRVEKILGTFLDGEAVVYSGGLAAFHAAIVHYNPKSVFIGDGYHGCHGVLDILARNYGVKKQSLDSDPELIQKGDVVHLETPVNPTGLAFDIEHYAKIAHSRGAYLLVDATFAPPPLFHPFKWGADMIMHSATKYFGGHSDLLAGVLVTKDLNVKAKLLADRDYLGTITPSLESWLLLRSLRTYVLRIRVQYENANKVVKYLAENRSEFPSLLSITHASLQKDEFVKRQLPLGGGPVFSITVKDSETARRLPSKLKLFHHATSLGGVESLVEWRAMSDPSVAQNIIRISIGAENADDLINDLKQALI